MHNIKYTKVQCIQGIVQVKDLLSSIGSPDRDTCIVFLNGTWVVGPKADVLHTSWTDSKILDSGSMCWLRLRLRLQLSKKSWLQFRLRLQCDQKWSRLQACLRLRSRNCPSLTYMQIKVHDVVSSPMPMYILVVHNVALYWLGCAWHFFMHVISYHLDG